MKQGVSCECHWNSAVTGEAVAVIGGAQRQAEIGSISF
jgi:hypothetical protein